MTETDRILKYSPKNRQQTLQNGRRQGLKKPAKPARCTRGHDMLAPRAATYCRGQASTGHWICRQCRQDAAQQRKHRAKTYTCQRSVMSENDFTRQYLALQLKKEQAATHWERDTIEQEMQAMQRRHHSGKGSGT